MVKKKHSKRSKDDIRTTTYTGNIHPRDPALADLFGYSQESDCGIVVNENTIFNSSAVFAAVNLLSSTMGSIRCEVIEEDIEGNIVNNKFSREAKVLGHTPNNKQTAFTFFSTAEQHCVTWGNCYAEIEISNGGDLLNLWPILPNMCQPVIKDGTDDLYYEVHMPNGPDKYIKSDKIIHIPGLGFDGIKGYSVLDKAKDSLGLTLAGDKHVSKTIKNSAIPAGVLTTEQSLKDTQITRMRKSWADQHQGLDNRARIAILEAGLSYKGISMSPQDLELLSTRKFQIAEVARWFNIPPHMLKDLEKSSFSNITHQSEEFIVYSILPWIIRFEQEINRKIFIPKWTAKKITYCKFNFDVFMRPQMLERYRAYAIGVASGFLNRDEPRRNEGLNAIPDGKGKEFLTPLNMKPAGEDIQDAQAQP